MRYAFLCPTLVLLATASACGSLPPVEPGASPAFRHGGAHVIVLERLQLQRAQGSVLNALNGWVSQLRITRGDVCPRLEMRGRNSLQGTSDPSIYLDGAMAGNTCLLEQLRSEDIERVEVYPMGITSRPGYRNSSGGLILVFSRSARP